MWLDREIILRKPDGEKQVSYDITYMWKIKKKITQMNLQTERDPQTQKTNLWLPKGKGGRSLGLNENK